MAARKLVIIVDDDTSVLRAVQRVVKLHGFEAQVFDTVEGFRAEARLCEATCLILDIHLDGMTGTDLAGQLARSGCSLPIIFITAADSPVTREAAREAGGVAYLRKPFPAKHLIEAINKALQTDAAC